jgi:hypothetical protein
MKSLEEEIRKIIFSRVEYKYFDSQDSYMIGSPENIAKDIVEHLKKKGVVKDV